ncbi:MAG: hypothetical protein M1468_02700 [Candidatus Thermoplasmatota archaeon]|jgi:hypothetical protein|nr:hypothetical protein [Candidatus Thermoplasmatota archaeon]MCL5441557.1 hypothetical protein [Candidatus Thermoplasmatota archaeon]
MNELVRKNEKILEKNVTVELYYKLNFDGDRTCGYTKIFLDRQANYDSEEPYEIYMELYECGLSEEEATDRFNKVIGEVKSGKIDVGS